MTMKFRTVKAQLETLLGAAAAGRYRVEGYQAQGLSDAEVFGNNRLVQIIFSEGDHPKSASGYGPYAHDCTYKIVLTVSQSAACDLSALESGVATPSEKAAALAALQPAAKRADDALDELYDHVFQELMKGDNENLGITSFYLSNRWIKGFQKLNVTTNGEDAVLSGELTFSCRVDEEVVSTDEADLDFIDATLKPQDDEVVRTGVLEEY